MKRIIVFIAAAALAASMTSCTNENWGFGNYVFRHAHLNCGDSGQCVTVKSWHDNSVGCEIHTPAGAIYASEGTYILFEDKHTCPFC